MTARTSVGALRRDLSGYVAAPPDPAYAPTLDIDNGRARLSPACVVFPRSIPDVSRTLRFAQDCGLPLTVKGGGHSAAGYCLNRGGVVLDMSLMNDMKLDRSAQILRVQMGSRWEDVYRHLLDTGTGLIPVGGGCLTVGLPGFLLGGGYSFTSRSYGLGSDNVLSIDLVTADGVRHHLREDAEAAEDRDLFWACRGGGGGNFGVAVAAELRVHRPRTATMLIGEISYPLDAAQEVIGYYNEWVETLPDELAVYGYLGHQADPADPGRQLRTFRITPVFNGAYADGFELLRPMLRYAPVTAELYDMALPAWENTNGKSTLVGHRQAYIRSGVMAPRGMTPDVVDIYQRFMNAAPSPDSFVVWMHGGGRVSELPAGSSAFPHRDGRFIFEVKSIWSSEAETRANVEWAYHFGEELRPHFTGAYVNYIDPLLPDWKQMYYAGNYARLLRIKRQADPAGFFRFQQGVGSEFEPSRAEPLDLSPLNRTVVT